MFKRRNFLEAHREAISTHKGVLRSHHGISAWFSGLITSLRWKIAETLIMKIFFVLYLN
jgi:antibiotic biosynthesis monooxygenase (ABM) superfamily enzyme